MSGSGVTVSGSESATCSDRRSQTGASRTSRRPSGGSVDAVSAFDCDNSQRSASWLNSFLGTTTGSEGGCILIVRSSDPVSQPGDRTPQDAHSIKMRPASPRRRYKCWRRTKQTSRSSNLDDGGINARAFYPSHHAKPRAIPCPSGSSRVRAR